MFIEILKSYINGNINCARWILEQYSNQEILSECLIKSNCKDMRFANVGIIYCALLKIYPDEKHTLKSYIDAKTVEQKMESLSLLSNFILVVISGMFRARSNPGYST